MEFAKGIDAFFRCTGNKAMAQPMNLIPQIQYISIYIKLKVCLSVCLSAIEIKLETFRYKQTYESYITFSREAKYGILISIRIVYGRLRAYI